MSNQRYEYALGRTYYATRAAGNEIRQMIAGAVEPGAQVVLDFGSVVAASIPFLDALVCGLVTAGYAVRVKGMDQDVADTMDQALARRSMAGKVTRG